MIGLIIKLVGLALLGIGGVALFYYRARRPSLQRPRHFDAEQLSFEYPRNWKVSEDKYDGGGVWSIEGSGSALIVIQAMGRDAQIPFDEWAADWAQEFQSSFDGNMLSKTKLIGREEGSWEPTSRTIAGQSIRGIAHEFDVRAFDDHDAHRLEFFGLNNADVAVYVVTYVEPAELEVLGAGFDHVLDTLRDASGAPFGPLQA